MKEENEEKIKKKSMTTTTIEMKKKKANTNVEVFPDIIQLVSPENISGFVEYKCIYSEYTEFERKVAKPYGRSMLRALLAMDDKLT